MSGFFSGSQLSAPAATGGIEMLVPLAPRTFLVPEAGLQHVHIHHARAEPVDLFFPGQFPVSFTRGASCKMRQTNAFVGLGMEQQLHRVRIQLFGRAHKRLGDRITYREITNFSTSGRPDNEFTVTVKAG